jgi:hypothetical protein
MKKLNATRRKQQDTVGPLACGESADACDMALAVGNELASNPSAGVSFASSLISAINGAATSACHVF